MREMNGDANVELDIVQGHDTGSQLGKRYCTTEATALEILVIKAGKGSLSLGAEPLVFKETKPLPSSD